MGPVIVLIAGLVSVGAVVIYVRRRTPWPRAQLASLVLGALAALVLLSYLLVAPAYRAAQHDYERMKQRATAIE